MKSVKVEASIILNCLIGPFDRAGHFRRFSECAAQVMERCDHHDPIFRYLYTDITFALGLHKKPEVGSETHMQQTWEHVKKCPLFYKKSCIVRLGRWFHHELGAVNFFQWAPVMLMVLLHMGLELGWWNHISETPLCSKEEKIELLGEAGQQDAEDLPRKPMEGSAGVGEKLPRTVKESNMELEKKRRSANGNLHFAALFLSRSRETRLWQAALWFCEPFRVRHARM